MLATILAELAPQPAGPAELASADEAANRRPRLIHARHRRRGSARRRLGESGAERTQPRARSTVWWMTTSTIDARPDEPALPGFGLDSFRPGQREGPSKRRSTAATSLVVMPTGGGKVAVLSAAGRLATGDMAARPAGRRRSAPPDRAGWSRPAAPAARRRAVSADDARVGGMDDGPQRRPARLGRDRVRAEARLVPGRAPEPIWLGAPFARCASTRREVALFRRRPRRHCVAEWGPRLQARTTCACTTPICRR